jgi:hypothetical protein
MSEYDIPTDSKGTVALSVSIIAILCPCRTESPSLTSHLPILPSVIVGDNAGIVNLVINAIPMNNIKQVHGQPLGSENKGRSRHLQKPSVVMDD